MTSWSFVGFERVNIVLFAEVVIHRRRPSSCLVHLTLTIDKKASSHYDFDLHAAVRQRVSPCACFNWAQNKEPKKRIKVLNGDECSASFASAVMKKALFARNLIRRKQESNKIVFEELNRRCIARIVYEHSLYVRAAY